MNILYFSDDYAKNVCGTKISIFNEMKKRGYNVIWIDKNFFVKYRKDINVLITEFNKLIIKNNINQVWLVHSSLVMPIQLKEYLYNKEIIVIGFGMSDPYYFDHNKRFFSYDIYVTNSYLISGKYRNIIPTIYNPTAMDLSFHKLENRKKTIFASVIGRGEHPRFNDREMRLNDIRFLRNKKIDVKVYGKDWGDIKVRPFIEGNNFLNVIYASNIGLDLQDTFSPLAHRMFEYSGCGIPVITRFRKEVLLHFEFGKEILFYNDRKELYEQLKYYNDNIDKLKEIGYKAYLRCIKCHDIKYRVDNLLKEINNIIGEKIF